MFDKVVHVVLTSQLKGPTRPSIKLDLWAKSSPNCNQVCLDTYLGHVEHGEEEQGAEMAAVVDGDGGGAFYRGRRRGEGSGSFNAGGEVDFNGRWFQMGRGSDGAGVLGRGGGARASLISCVRAVLRWKTRSGG
jgi:hypothetical protein